MPRQRLARSATRPTARPGTLQLAKQLGRQHRDGHLRRPSAETDPRRPAQPKKSLLRPRRRRGISQGYHGSPRKRCRGRAPKLRESCRWPGGLQRTRRRIAAIATPAHGPAGSRIRQPAHAADDAHWRAAHATHTSSGPDPVQPGAPPSEPPTQNRLSITDTPPARHGSRRDKRRAASGECRPAEVSTNAAKRRQSSALYRPDTRQFRPAHRGGNQLAAGSIGRG